MGVNHTDHRRIKRALKFDASWKIMAFPRTPATGVLNTKTISERGDAKFIVQWILSAILTRIYSYIVDSD